MTMMNKQYLIVFEGFVPKIVYDPKYGIPTTRKECTKEHSQYIEHLMVQRLGKNTCKVVGKFIDKE